MAEQLDIIPYCRELTEQEKKGVDGMLHKMKTHSIIPESSLEVADLLRFLRARDFDLEKAFTMYSNYLKWKAEYKPWQIDDAIQKHEEAKGYSIHAPFITKQGQQVVVMFWGLYDASNRNVDHVVRFTMHEVHKILESVPRGQDKQHIMIFEMTGAGWKNFDIHYWKAMGPMASENLPETLSHCVVLRASWLIQLAHNMVKPFVDKKTMGKVRLVGSDASKIKDTLHEFFHEDQLWDFWGGKNEWRPHNYSALMKLAGRKEDANIKNTNTETHKEGQSKDEHH